MNDFQCSPNAFGKIKDDLLKSVGWKYGAQCMASDRAFDHLWNSYIDLLDTLSYLTERDRAETEPSNWPSSVIPAKGDIWVDQSTGERFEFNGEKFVEVKDRAEGEK